MYVVRRARPEKLPTDPQDPGYECSLYSSFANATEIGHVLRGLELFCNYGIFTENEQRSKSVAVICFYKQQVHMRRFRVSCDADDTIV